MKPIIHSVILSQSIGWKLVIEEFDGDMFLLTVYAKSTRPGFESQKLSVRDFVTLRGAQQALRMKMRTIGGEWKSGLEVAA